MQQVQSPCPHLSTCCSRPALLCRCSALQAHEKLTRLCAAI